MMTVLLLSGVLLAFTGCNSATVRYSHGHYSGYYPGYYHGVPPHAPAHGYRHHYYGHDLAYDSYLGVYIVLGYSNHYYHSGHFYRYDPFYHHWYHRTSPRYHWKKYHAHHRALPDKVIRKHAHNAHGSKKHANRDAGKRKLPEHVNLNWNQRDFPVKKQHNFRWQKPESETSQAYQVHREQEKSDVHHLSDQVNRKHRDYPVEKQQDFRQNQKSESIQHAPLFGMHSNKKSAGKNHVKRNSTVNQKEKPVRLHNGKGQSKQLVHKNQDRDRTTNYRSTTREKGRQHEYKIQTNNNTVYSESGSEKKNNRAAKDKRNKNSRSRGTGFSGKNRTFKSSAFAR